MSNNFIAILRQYEKRLGFETEIRWLTFLSITSYHIFGIYWCTQYAFPVKWQTVVFAFVMLNASGTGITCGAHRLWAHKSYKAKLPLSTMLLFLYASSGQYSLYNWVRDHRLHHKFSDTDADPHNANRGFFFSHIGWLMMNRNDRVIQQGKKIDMSDIEKDPMIMLQKKYENPLKLLFCHILPTMTGIMLWNETWQCAVAWQNFIRFLTVLHSELTVNSLAHAFGYKPYNKNILASQNRLVVACTFGEGWHNYHHVFPFDYRAAEYFDIWNWSMVLIHLFVRMGLAYDLKKATPEMINSVANRLGDRKLIQNSEWDSEATH